MSAPDRDLIRRLKHLNDTIWYACEQAEAQLSQLQSLLDWLAQAGLWQPRVLLGKIVLERSYPPREGGNDSIQLIQAALAIPGGVGTVFWDSEEYADLRRLEEGPESAARLGFVPYAGCEAAIKALLIGQLDALLEQLEPIADLKSLDR